MNKKQKSLIKFLFLIIIISGIVLLLFSFLDTSHESTFIFHYSFSKTIVLIIHLMLLVPLFYSYLKINNNKKNFQDKILLLIEKTPLTLLSLSLTFLSLILLLFINQSKESFPFWYIYQKLFYLLFFFTIIISSISILLLLLNNSKKAKNYHVIFLFIVFFATMLINFQTNIFARVNSQWFEKYKESTDSLIMGRIVNWNLDKKENKSLFMVQYIPNEPSNLHIFTKQLMESENLISENDYKRIEIYTGQTGLQATIFGIFSKYLPLSLETQYSIYALSTSILLSLTLTIFLYWLYLEFEIFPIIITWISILQNKWLTAAGGSTYWQYWSFFAGFVLIAFFFKRQKIFDSRTKRKFIILIIAIETIKFSMGFEYITSFLITTSLPIFYYSYIYKDPIKIFLKKIFTLFILSIGSFITSFLILVIKISYFYKYENEWQNPLDLIKHRFIRTFGNKEIITLNERYHDITTKTILDIFKIYFIEGKPLIGNFRAIHFTILLVILLIVIIIINQRKHIQNNIKKLNGVALITFLSILSPISWFVFAKGHSYLHPHFNYILFSMPFLILLPTLLAYTIKFIITKKE